MEPKFTLNRPKISDDEIEAKKDFDALVKKFKEQSIQDARKRKLNPKLRKLVYTTVIAGFLVVCTVSINELTQNKQDEKTATSLTETKPVLKDAQVKKFIQPIKQESKLAYSKYTVNANKGGVITHSTKSQITVPKSAFVKKDGKEVTGNVEIHYREMHDVADQLVSGIPMVYDSAGSRYHFESAGMVDIKGYHNGEEVFIRPGKNLDINMVSRKDGSRFNVYRLDTIGKKWDYIGKDKILGINELAAGKTNPHNAFNEPSYTAEEKKIQQELQILEEKKEELIVVTDKKIAALPVPAEPQKPVAASKERKQFTLDVNYDKFPELKAFKGCIFEVGEENTHYTKEFNTITWSDAYITAGTVKGKNYTLNLEKNYRKEKLIVYPVLAGQKLEEAQKVYEGKFEEYQTSVADRKAKEKKYREELEKDLEKVKKEQEIWIAKMEAERKKKSDEAIASVLSANKQETMDFKVRRVFQISNFGVFNTDCAQRLPSGVIANAVFVSAKGILRPNVAYLIDKDQNIMYTYTAADMENFKFDNKRNYQIIATVNNEVFMCDNSSFKSAQNQGDKTIFNFTPLDLTAMDADELRKKLGV